jgi:N-alpha-acetyltransferase 40
MPTFARVNRRISLLHLVHTMPVPKRPMRRSADLTEKLRMSNSKSKRPKRALNPQKQAKSLIQRVNALSLAQFSANYFPQSIASMIGDLQLTLASCTEMPASLHEACVALIELTSGSHYQASEKGWSKPRKLREMRHPAMKYMLLLPSPLPLTEGEDETGDPDHIVGFLSFMITEEDGFEVIYCYELHLQPKLQGKGVGKRMMEVMEIIGDRIGLEKAMLTVFRSNVSALKAYGSWGYRVDEFTPEAKKFRDGTVKESSYLILSKERSEFAKVEQTHEQKNACASSADKNDLPGEEFMGPD